MLRILHSHGIQKACSLHMVRGREHMYILLSFPSLPDLGYVVNLIFFF